MTPAIEGARVATEDWQWAAVRWCSEAVGAAPQSRVVSRRWVGPERQLTSEEEEETVGESDLETAVVGGDRTR
jgi:hypothetical protein